MRGMQKGVGLEEVEKAKAYESSSVKESARSPADAQLFSFSSTPGLPRGSTRTTLHGLHTVAITHFRSLT